MEGGHRGRDVGSQGRFFAGEKIFRLGALKGGSQNQVIYVGNNAKKREVSNDLISREGGTRPTGAPLMASLGWRYAGVGALPFALKGGRMNAADYIEIATNT